MKNTKSCIQNAEVAYLEGVLSGMPEKGYGHVESLDVQPAR